MVYKIDPLIGEGDLGYVENLEQQDIGQESPSKSLVVREEIFILFRIQPFTESDWGELKWSLEVTSAWWYRDTVVLNVGGMIHQVRWETIEKFPKSRLHSLRYAMTEGDW